MQIWITLWCSNLRACSRMVSRVKRALIEHTAGLRYGTNSLDPTVWKLMICDTGWSQILEMPIAIAYACELVYSDARRFAIPVWRLATPFHQNVCLKDLMVSGDQSGARPPSCHSLGTNRTPSPCAWWTMETRFCSAWMSTESVSPSHHFFCFGKKLYWIEIQRQNLLSPLRGQDL